jgi:succinyl-CoA:acetate CoA-transferase
VDPLKIAGIIISREPMRSIPEEGTTEESDQIAHHLIAFFENEVSKGKMPDTLFPLQTGLGSLGKAILKRLGESDFEGLQTFSALLNDAVLDLMDLGKLAFVSGTGLYFSSEGFNRFYENIQEYKKMIILRPVDISAHPELIQRLGVIALNGAVEVDIYGHINSSHIGGGRVITGVAGSIEYARNGALSVFMTPSIGKRGDISRIVPMVAHVDHTEHDVHVIVTEQGVADIRGLDPRKRAMKIINHCAHPDYRPLLMEYFERAKSEVGGHEPQMLDEAFTFHKRLKETGSMKI